MENDRISPVQITLWAVRDATIEAKPVPAANSKITASRVSSG